MYENQTYQEILKRALSRIPNSLDKREGSIIYDALAPACYEIAELYMSLDNLLSQTNILTAHNEFLTLKAAELGVNRRPATKARRKGTFDVPVLPGNRFSINDINYIIIEQISGPDYILECETPGTIGNQYVGNLIPIDYIQDLTSAIISDIIAPGSNVEEDEALRKRYLEVLQVAPFGGNVADYKERTLSIGGVGATKVYPIHNGGGTVKIVIMDNTFAKPSPTLVDDVQEELDPTGSQGLGYGIAPIGHIVTVEGASEITIDVSFTITLQNDYEWEEVEAHIISSIEEYLLQLRKNWGNEQQLVVRLSRVESSILSIQGVLDVNNTKLNNLTSNIVLEEDEIPVLGSVNNI